MQEIKTFLSIVGILSEKGTNDILGVCEYTLKHGSEYTREMLINYAKGVDDSTKNIEQRMRRTMKKALENIAHTLLDEFGSDVIREYAIYVFDYKSVKDEMEFILGKRKIPGRVNINKFIDGLLAYREIDIKE